MMYTLNMNEHVYKKFESLDTLFNSIWRKLKRRYSVKKWPWHLFDVENAFDKVCTNNVCETLRASIEPHNDGHDLKEVHRIGCECPTTVCEH